MKYYVTQGTAGDSLLFLRADLMGLTTDLYKAETFSGKKARRRLKRNSCRRMYTVQEVLDSATIQVNRHDLFKTK
jgi:hypothetical protein